MMTVIVYLATNLITGERYVGRTVKLLASRRCGHASRARTFSKNDPLHIAIRSYGIEMLRFRVVASFKDEDSAATAERRLISIWRPEYNVKPGDRRRQRNVKRIVYPHHKAAVQPWCLEGEQWRSVVGHEGRYEVSDLGRVRSLSFYMVCADGGRRHWRGRILRLCKNADGYLWFRPGLKPSVAVHTAVAAAFLGPRPEGENVLHKDDNPGNPGLNNLYYGTQKQNMADRSARRPVSSKPFVLEVGQVREIKEMIGTFSDRKIAKLYSVSPRTIRLIRIGRSYSYVGA